MRSSAQERQAAVEAFDRGLADSGFAQRPIIRRTLIGALLVLPLPLVIVLRDLYTAPEGAPSPAEQLEQTIWGAGVRIVTDVSLNPLKPQDVPVGGLVAAVPENLHEVEMQLLARIPAEFAKDAHHWLILHGRYVCQARKPRCRACAVADCCDFDAKTDQA